MKRKIERKVFAGVEMILMIVAMFAFAHGIALTDEVFAELDEQYEETRVTRSLALENVEPVKSRMSVVFGALVKKMRNPMIPVVSAVAAENDMNEAEYEAWVASLPPGTLIEEETRITYSISSESEYAGCCLISKDGQKCGVAAPENCIDTSPFAEGVLCAYTSFCEKGCCYNSELGIYDKNVLEVDCPMSWTKDPNCNMPGANLGCCVLGTVTSYETEGQCRVDTLIMALGDSDVVDWRDEVDEGECFLLSSLQKEGACVLGEGVCKFNTEGECYSLDGDFSEGRLCTSSSLNTNCEMSEETSCVEGKDGVYFVDSCGNYANVYDSSRVDDINYWDMVIGFEDSCDGDGSANSETCGNCNRFLGGICKSAFEDGVDVDYGSYYCRDTSCLFDGESYENGESWCVYDGAIGNGDDVAGSRHWKYVCSQGVVQVEPCADYRNQICIQSNTFEAGGEEIEFRNAACVTNNWRECVGLNGEDGGMRSCADTLNCRVDNVIIADKFAFSVCLPKYPAGFSLSNERYMETAESICGMADQTCTVVWGSKSWGGCEIVANKGCLGEGFVQEMNDFCRGLGDCGGSVNIEGKYSKNYGLMWFGDGAGTPMSLAWRNSLIDLAEVVPGQFAEVENYTEFLEAAGILGEPGVQPGSESYEGLNVNNYALGVGGFGVALVATGMAIHSVSFFTYMASGTLAASFAGAAMGAAIGMIAGAYLAKSLGLSPNGSILMAVGGAMIGGYIGLALVIGFADCWNIVGWVFLIIAVVLIIVSVFLPGCDKDAVHISFKCKPWKAPIGGDDCDKCNGNPLKPCSEYRCDSLGAACGLVNIGMEDEMCASSQDDGGAPVLIPQVNVISEGNVYDDISDDGFSLTASGGGCIDAYTPLAFGIVTDELAYCKFDVMPIEFESMSYDLGANAYLYNHTTVFPLPDPSHGQSQGANWTGDLSLFVKCQDVFGHESFGFYEINLCVNEGEDVTTPRIVSTEPADDSIVGFNVSSKNVSIVINEFSECRWDIADIEYSLMGNDFDCDDRFGIPSSPLGYVCTTILPLSEELSVNSGQFDYYVRCMDQPWLDEVEGQTSEVENGEAVVGRNANSESFVYRLRKPENKITIEYIMPDSEFESSTGMTSIDLEVRTSGGGEWHHCSYSFSGYDRMIQFFETGEARTHIQPLNRPAGLSDIYVECEDETGDFVRGETWFNIIHDTSTPSVARVWQSGGNLYIVTNEDAECRYVTTSCGFAWDDGEFAGNGLEHSFGIVHGITYYIKCEDEFGNVPSGCSITTQAL